MKTFLVTGAAGFIGGALAQYLISEGHRVVTVDNLTTGKLESIPQGVVFHEGNTQDYNIIDSLKKYSFDCIFHIAGQSSGEISFDDPIYDLQTNTQSTILLLKLAKEINCPKFIYASTMSVYGETSVCAEEIDRREPKSFYGIGKLASEEYLRVFGSDLTTTALRLFNVYGPGQNMDNFRQGMVSIFLQQALTSSCIVVKGSLDRFRDFVFIDDVVQAFVQAEKIDNGTNNVYNIGTGKMTKVKELIEVIQSGMNKTLDVRVESGTPGDQFGIYANSRKAFTEMGWEPKVKLKEGVNTMIRYYQK